MSLVSVEIPNSITSIGNYAFSDCSSLVSIDIPNSVTSIGNSAFQYCYGIKSIEIPNSVVSIGHSAFNGCYCKYIDIPSSVTYIGKMAFTAETINIANLSVWMDANMRGDDPAVGYYNLYVNGQKFTDLIVPDDISIVPQSCFGGCLSLESITLHKGVKILLGGAFSYCNNVKKIFCGNTTPPKCGANALDGISRTGCTLYVPKGSVDMYRSTVLWNEFTNIEEGEIGEGDEPEQCAKPTIAYVDGKLIFTSNTPGTKFLYNVSENCSGKNFTTDGEVEFAPVYTITAYATAEGMYNSEPETKVIDFSKGGSEINVIYIYESSEPTDIALETGETIKLYLSTGKAMIVDAPKGSVISVYSNTGAMVKTLTVNDVATTIELPTDNIYIIKVGTKVFKVKV